MYYSWCATCISLTTVLRAGLYFPRWTLQTIDDYLFSSTALLTVTVSDNRSVKALRSSLWEAGNHTQVQPKYSLNHIWKKSSPPCPLKTQTFSGHRLFYTSSNIRKLCYKPHNWNFKFQRKDFSSLALSVETSHLHISDTQLLPGCHPQIYLWSPASHSLYSWSAVSTIKTHFKKCKIISNLQPLPLFYFIGIL